MNTIQLEKNDLKEWYLALFKQFEHRLNGGQASGFHKIRKEAISRFSEIGFPHLRMEEWRYTDISPLLQRRFEIEKTQLDQSKIDINPFLFEAINVNLIVFVNGQFSPSLSNIQSPAGGMIIDNLAQAFKQQPGLIESYLAKYAEYNQETFTALNTAFAQEGAFIYVPDNHQIEAPIHILNLAVVNGQSFLSHPRNLVIVGKNSQVKIIAASYGENKDEYFQNLVSEIILKENSVADFIKIQNESERAFLISCTNVYQESNTRFSTVGIDLGGALVRNNLTITLAGENSETQLSGFYMVTDSQLIDNHTNIDHAKPSCRSNELYKGILDGKSKGVFSGTVLVRPEAQKTNAYQKNKNLLLSKEAQINSKPQLKIYADDVRCTHGATIGQLDENAVFYLRQRGISEKNALAMLRYAFAADVFNEFKIDAVRLKIDQLIMEKFKRLQG